jgi:glutaredoxin-related protein
MPLVILVSGLEVLSHFLHRAGVKEYSNWPTYPQLYLKGELIGGCDIVMEMAQSGELKQLLQEKLGAPPVKPEPAAADGGRAGTAAAAGAGGAAAAVNSSGLTPELKGKLEGLVNEQPVMLFMKGTPEAPRWGVARIRCTKMCEAVARLRCT